VRSAPAIRASSDGLNEADAWLDLRIRIGVATGESLVTLGAEAARIQSAAPVNGILIDEETYRQSAAMRFRRFSPFIREHG
jgi:class 3 adenylate cyclase